MDGKDQQSVLDSDEEISIKSLLLEMPPLKFGKNEPYTPKSETDAFVIGIVLRVVHFLTSFLYENIPRQ
jgi:hypothetical protein